MNNQEEIHEHPLYNGEWHQAVWMKYWVTSGANDDGAFPPAPVYCAICGKARE